MSKPDACSQASSRNSRNRITDEPASARLLLLELNARLLARGASRSTVKIYRGWTRRFLACTEELPRIDPEQAIARFVQRLEAESCSQASLRQALAALGFYFREVLGQDLAPVLRRYHPAKRPGETRAKIRPATSESSSVDAARRLVLRLAEATGRPTTAIEALRIGDIDLERCRVFFRSESLARRRRVGFPIPADLREAVIEQVGESWRVHQIEYLARLERYAPAGYLTYRLPTSVFRRQPLFPALAPPSVRRSFGRYLTWWRRLNDQGRFGQPEETRLPEETEARALSVTSEGSAVGPLDTHVAQSAD